MCSASTYVHSTSNICTICTVCTVCTVCSYCTYCMYCTVVLFYVQCMYVHTHHTAAQVHMYLHPCTGSPMPASPLSEDNDKRRKCDFKHTYSCTHTYTHTHVHTHTHTHAYVCTDKDLHHHSGSRETWLTCLCFSGKANTLALRKMCGTSFTFSPP